MLATEDLSKVVQGVGLLFAAAAVASVLPMLAYHWELTGDTSRTLIYVTRSTTATLASIVAVVGGAIVGTALEDPADAAVGSAVGALAGYLLLASAIVATLAYVDPSSFEGVETLLAEDGSVVAFFAANSAVVAGIAALAPSRLAAVEGQSSPNTSSAIDASESSGADGAS